MKIDVVGEIGWDFTDTDFINEVKAKADGDTIEIMVNSPGGSFFAGFAMYEFLKERPEKVKVTVTGYALSAAMYLVLAADELEVGEDALFMLHRVWSILIGNTKEFSDEAKILGLFDSVMFGILSRETGRSLEDLQNEIDTAPGGELWYKGGELLNKLFRNKIEDDPASGASQNVSPEVVSPGADSQVTSQLLCKENQYKSELETVTQQRNEVFKELEQERDRVVGILSVAGASSDVLDAVHKGMSVANFGMQRAKSERNIGEIANHIPPAPMSNVEKSTHEYSQKLRERAERKAADCLRGMGLSHG